MKRTTQAQRVKAWEQFRQQLRQQRIAPGVRAYNALVREQEERREQERRRWS